jgi:nicotinate-nucleotide adenylyltransferase
MFDPIHNGHIEVASFARNYLSLDLVKLVPCSIPNHRKNANSSAFHRLAMLNLAIEKQDGLQVDSIELKREGISYTADTLQELKRQNKASQLVFVLGLDSFNTIAKWHDWEKLFELCSFFVLARSGAKINKETSQVIKLNERLAKSNEAFFQQSTGRILFAKEFNNDLSSTKVRNQFAEGKDLHSSLDDAVYSYIKQHNLYH